MFEFPKSKKEFNSLSPEEQLFFEHLFGERVIQATRELQSSALSMGFFKMPKNLNDKSIRECFRVLSYTSTSAVYSPIEKEYNKALAMASDAQKVTMLSMYGTIIIFIGLALWG